jgi:hypothetical protein
VGHACCYALAKQGQRHPRATGNTVRYTGVIADALQGFLALNEESPAKAGL